MMLFSEILFLSFAMNVWATPLPLDVDGLSEYVEEPMSPTSEDLNINKQEISITKSSQPIAEIFDPFHQGHSAISQAADKSYQKLLTKVPRLNYQLDPRFLNGYVYPLSQQQQPMINNINSYPSNNWGNLYSKENPNVVSGSHQVKLSAQVGPPVMDNVPFNTNVNYSVWQPLQDLFNQFTTNNQYNRNENRLARQTVGNYQVFYPSQGSQEYPVPIINQDEVKVTTANPEVNDELSESGENQSGSTMTTSTAEALQTTTAIPTEFESTTTFEMTTEIPTTESNEEIILSTTQPELLDKNAEIDEAIAFNMDGGDISSIQESATQSSEINKDNFYVIYERPTLIKKDNSLVVNAKVGMAVALSGSNIDDMKIINLV